MTWVQATILLLITSQLSPLLFLPFQSVLHTEDRIVFQKISSGFPLYLPSAGQSVGTLSWLNTLITLATVSFHLLLEWNMHTHTLTHAWTHLHTNSIHLPGYLGLHFHITSSEKPSLISTSSPPMWSPGTFSPLSPPLAPKEQELCLFNPLFWRRQWHPTPVLLPGKSHGQRSLVGCSPWDR